MRDLDLITARGHGVWGERYDIEVITNQTTRHDWSGHHSQTITSYDLLILDLRVGRRRFDSEAKREAFLAHFFEDVALHAVEPPESADRPHPLAELIGEGLSSVTFVVDYVQLRFNGPPLNLYVWPRIRTRGHILQRPDARYAGTLIGLIGVRVSAVDELLDQGLALDFDDGTRLTIPLDGSELVGAEVAEYTNRRSQETMVWRPGDEPIAWQPEQLAQPE